MMSGNYTTIDNQKVSGSVPAVSDSPGHVAVKFADSNLQTFPPSGAQGKIFGGSQPPRDADAKERGDFDHLHLHLRLHLPLLRLRSSDRPSPSSATSIDFDPLHPRLRLRNSRDHPHSPSSLTSTRDSTLVFDLDLDPDIDFDSTLDFADTFSKPASGSDEPLQQQSGWFQVFSIAYYRPYFDVETADVMERIKDSLFPFKGSFSEKTSNNPDLYGPFWICTTLIFVAASIGTFVTYVAHKLQKKEWNYDVNLVTWSAGLFYGYVTVVPVGLYMILKYSSVPSGLVQLFCLYGYSLFIFIPALCLSVVPLELFRWVVAGVAGFMSATFVALNLRNHIKSAGERWFLIVTGIFLLQLALSIVLKLYLFTITV